MLIRQRWQVVDDFSSKLDLPISLETVESMDANHMQMARCSNRADQRYKDILSVLKQFIRSGMLENNGTRLQGLPSTVRDIEAQRSAAGEWSGAPSR